MIFHAALTLIVAGFAVVFDEYGKAILLPCWFLLL